MILTCQHCKLEFVTTKPRRKFCSHDCHDNSRKAIDVNKLQRLTFSGETKAEIARQLGVSYMTVRRTIATYGLERQWREHRYA